MSEIIGVDVRWSDAYVNEPSLLLRVSPKPTFGAYHAYELADGPGRRDKGYLAFVAAAGPLRSYFIWQGRPDDGFGGWKRSIELADHHEIPESFPTQPVQVDPEQWVLPVVGGWSSRAAVVNTVLDETLVDCAYDATLVERTGGISCACEFDALTEALALFIPSLELYTTHLGAVAPKWRGRPPKHEWLRDVETPRRDRLRALLEESHGRRWYDRIDDATRAELAQRPYSALGPA